MANFINKFLNQTRKPEESILGKMMVRGMNTSGHQKTADWSRKYIDFSNVQTILDIGCGGGMNIKKMKKILPESTIYGIDYSLTSVDISKKTNKNEIATGKVIIQEGNVLNLEFEDDMFDLITAYETIYFWPDILNSFKQVYRVLRQGGKFFIHQDSTSKEYSEKYIKIIEGMNVYTTDEIKDLLTKAGFKDIEIYDKNNKAKTAAFLAYK